MSLLKSWSIREGGGNQPSKAMGPVRALLSGKMALTGKTDLSLYSGPLSLQEPSTG